MLLTIGAAFAITFSVGVRIAARIQQRKTAAEIKRLTRLAAAPPASIQEDLDSLPAPVARYLRWALPEPLSLRYVRIQQIGTLRTDVQTDRWMDFTAEHIAAPAAPGFVWNARVAIAPLAGRQSDAD